MSKRTIQAMIINCLMISVIYANGLNAQEIKSVKETFIRISIQNANLMQVFNEIELKTNYEFSYENKDLDREFRFTGNFKKGSVADVLLEISKQTGLKFKQVNNNIHISKKDNMVRDEEFLEVIIQGITIIGRIISSEDESGLPGVNVVIKGTSQGTVTDVDGNYKLEVPDENSVLVFSSVGFTTEEVTVGNRTIIDFTLVPDISALEEIVVVGYGVVKKSDLTGAVSSLPTEYIKNQPVRSLTDMLAGRVAGVTLNRTSGDMGSPSKIRIRGANSISGNNAPLMVVDGVIGGSYGSIHDVESIEVLKDASATAIYGERASNGVILITTKRASSGGPNVRVLLNTGITYRDTDYPDLMNGGEYALFINDFYQSDIFTSQEIADFKKNGGTDWPGAITQKGFKSDYNISYSDEFDKMSVYISGRYAYEKGNMINTSKGGDYFLRTNIGFQPSKRLKFNLDIRAQKNKIQNGGLSTSDNKQHPLMQAILWSPTEPLWDDEEAGLYNLNDQFGALGYNPYMYTSEQDNFTKSSGVYATLNANWEIIDGLTYDVTGYTAKTSSVYGAYANTWLAPSDPYGYRNANDGFSWRLINNISYSKTFNDAHNISLTGVFETEGYEGWSLYGIGRKMPLPDVAKYYVIGLSNEQSSSSSFAQSTRVGYLGRLNYNFKSRYYFTASYRMDGKSGPENRIEENKFGGFPSMAISWRLSEESFMQENGIFDNLKLRASWGVTGNPSGFYATLMASRNYDYGIGADLLGYVPGVPANPNIRWEETTQLNLGLDFSILSGKLSFTIDFFDKLTDGLLTKLELPAYYGYGYTASYLQNLGKISNRGFEFTLDYKVIRKESFYWDLNFNLSTYKNEVLDLGDQGAFMTGSSGNGLLPGPAYRVEEGSPLGTMWGYKWLGIWSESEADEAAQYGESPGDNKYEDVNNDGAINLADDGQVIGNANPKFTWGFNSLLSYKNFELSILFQGMHGQDVFNIVRAAASTVHSDSRSIMLKDPATNYWTPTNQDSEWPNIHSPSNNKRLNSTKWIEDASWVRLRYIGFTYNIPKEFLKIGNLAVSLAAEDLLTFTKYKGYDPEVSASGNADVWGGIDMGTQPIPTTITLGVSLEF